LNEQGTLVGEYSSCASGLDRPFIWSESLGFVSIPIFDGAGDTEAYGINSSNQVVGRSLPKRSGNDESFRFDSGGLIELLPPVGGTFCRTGEINDAGIAVGNWGNSSTLASCIWTSTVATALQLPLGPYSSASDINNRDEVVGFMGSDLNTSHAYIWKDSEVTDLGVIPGGYSGFAYAINDNSQVVGSGRVLDESTEPPHIITRACLWSNGTALNLGVLDGYASSVANDINIHAEIVGYCSGTPDLFYRAFLWSNGRMIDLNEHIPSDLGLHIESASAINDAGQIAAKAFDTDNSYAIILSPRPRIAGDTNCDDLVNIDDLLNVIGAWGDTGPGLYEDINGDKVVNLTDLSDVLLNWEQE
jgi:probable HAF family extracellular repeat protein